MEGRKEGGEAWSLEPCGEGSPGFRGLPQEAGPNPARIPRKGLKSGFHLWPNWPQSRTLRDEGQGMKEGFGSFGEMAQADFPASCPKRPPTASRGPGRVVSAFQRKLREAQRGARTYPG